MKKDNAAEEVFTNTLTSDEMPRVRVLSKYLWMLLKSIGEIWQFIVKNRILGWDVNKLDMWGIHNQGWRAGFHRLLKKRIECMGDTDTKFAT